MKSSEPYVNKTVSIPRVAIQRQNKSPSHSPRTTRKPIPNQQTHRLPPQAQHTLPQTMSISQGLPPQPSCKQDVIDWFSNTGQLAQVSDSSGRHIEQWFHGKFYRFFIFYTLTQLACDIAGIIS